jgi:hypothetical protein
MSITLDTTKFTEALKKTLLNTSRDFADVLNGTAIEVITTAAKLTKKADKGDVVFSIERAGVASARQRRKHEHAMKVFEKPPLLVYLILNSRQKKAGGRGLNNSDMSFAHAQFLKRRIASIGFTAYAGWQKALLAVGGRGFGAGRKKAGFKASSADGGRGTKATPHDLMADFSNTATWIEHIGREPAQEALNLSGKRMMRHLEEKLSARAREASR